MSFFHLQISDGSDRVGGSDDQFHFIARRTWRFRYWTILLPHPGSGSLVTYRTILRCLNRGQSNVNDSYSPPSPQTLIPYFSACNEWTAFGETRDLVSCSDQDKARTSFRRVGRISTKVLPRCAFGCRPARQVTVRPRRSFQRDQGVPRAAVLIKIASIFESIISLRSSCWSRCQR